MALGLPENGKIVACEIDQEVAEIAEKNIQQFGLERSIDVKIGPALDTLQDLSEKNADFDLVFVDADKQNYINYVKFIFLEFYTNSNKKFN